MSYDSQQFKHKHKSSVLTRSVVQSVKTNSNVRFILGKAGTAKTTTLINTVETMAKQNKSIVILAYTHQAINNIRDILKQKTNDNTQPTPTLIINPLYKPADNEAINPLMLTNTSSPNQDSTSNIKTRTIHSFFQLKPGEEHDYKHRRIELPDVIFIDEISLVPDVLWTAIFNVVNYNSKCQLVLVGDILQLNPINKNKKPINANLMLSLQDFDCSFHEAMLIAEHLSNNIFEFEQYPKNISNIESNTTGHKLVLTKNYRSDTAINNIIEKMLDDPDEYKHHIFNDWDHIDEYVVLSSRYELLKKVYGVKRRPGIYLFNTRLGPILANRGDKMILTENLTTDFINGDIVTVVGRNTIRKQHSTQTYVFSDSDPQSMYTSYIPLLPHNFLTIHKAQGLGFDKVVVILDDMFEITMLYTAMTRTRKELKFILYNNDELEKIRIYNKAFKKLEKVVYS